MNTPISITAIQSVSALGKSTEEIWRNYQRQQPLFSRKEMPSVGTHFMAPLPPGASQEIKALRKENSMYEKLDKSVLQAIYTARKAVGKAAWEKIDFGVNIGSSRGATELFEHYHQEFVNTGKTATLASPTTTLGNISSWVSQDLATTGPGLSHSITCSTGLHSVLNGVAWLNGGLCEEFLVGASEAPLTPFTLAQMKALKLYSRAEPDDPFPNKSMDFAKHENTMILGEASTSVCLEKGKKDTSLASIIGIGYGTEKLTHSVSISNDAKCLQQSMKMALKNADLATVDAVVLHAPGTRKGDLSELNALKKVFPEKMPLLTSNKYLIGHTFGASGVMSLEMAVLMLQKQQFIANPLYENPSEGKKLNTILVNAVGFGGNAVSLIVSL